MTQEQNTDNGTATSYLPHYVSYEDKVGRMKLFFLPFLVLLAGVPARSLGQPAAETKPANSPPWKINKPIVTVEKTLHRKRPMGGGAVDYSVSYIGPKLERMEISNFVLQSDIADKV